MGLIADLKNIWNPKDAPAPPAWEGRLKSASYKSPSGKVIPFEYADLDWSIEKKTSVFESAAGSGTYVQDNGNTSHRIPMTIFMSGDNYDQKAAALISALLEKGEGVLTHPVLGNITVIPTGEIARADALASGAGQAIFTVSFYETTGLIFGKKKGIAQLADSFDAAAAGAFDEKLDVSDGADKANFLTKAKAATKKITRVMANVSASAAAVQSSVEGVGDSINRGIDLAVGSPLALARQTQILIGEPARIAGAAGARLDAYGNLASDIFSQTFGASPHEATADRNNFHYSKMLAGAFTGASLLALATDDTPDKKRADILNQMDRARVQAAQYRAWKDSGYSAVGGAAATPSNQPDGDGDAELNDLLSGVLSQLVEDAMEAKTEIREQISADRTPLDLCFEYYGTADKLEYLCQTNDFSADELILLPRGTEVVRYV